MLIPKFTFCIHKYNSEIVRNICFKGGYYEKLTCKKCGKVKNLYW
ncbi:hypothetical protein [uncultured Clostridium sp.]|nr:hypothetical protein [uncultured Clostridium sp.]